MENRFHTLQDRITSASTPDYLEMPMWCFLCMPLTCLHMRFPPYLSFPFVLPQNKNTPLPSEPVGREPLPSLAPSDLNLSLPMLAMYSLSTDICKEPSALSRLCVG